jgi:glucose/arabinose dehydrogenase
MRKHIVRIVILGIVIAAGVFYWLTRPDHARLSIAAVSGRLPQITPPRSRLLPTIEFADARPWPAGKMPTPAPGLAVNAFAKGLDHPRWLYALPNGDVLVAETNAPADHGGGVKGWVERQLMDRAGEGGTSANRITLLRDTNHDGVADQRSVLIGGLNSPFGMALMNGYLYIADTDALLRVPFKPGETRITARPEKVIDLPDNGGHWTRNVIPGPDGRTLYVSVGSKTNIANDGIDAETNRADILQVDPVSKTARIYASGMRNPNGMAYEPRSGRFWAVVNERDGMGSDLPPDYMSAVELGDNFGWPWYYWGGYPDHRVTPDNPELQQYSKRPDFALGPHVAALGLAFTNGGNLSPRFSDGAAIGEHGSWDRYPRSGYKVVYVPFGNNGFPVPGAKPIDLLTGFLSADGDTAYGRPVGVAMGPDGGLLVADDVGNTIWRVSAKR